MDEQELREQIALDIEALMDDGNGNAIPSVFALLWIKKCANRARGIA
jgi:hypothetical protein